LSIAIALVAVGGILALLVGRDDPTGIDAAVELARDSDAWATADGSAKTMLAIGVALRRDAEDCAKARSADDADCRPLFAGSAHAQTGAVGVLRCTRVELFDAREAMITYLGALEDAPSSARLPALPYCT